MAEFVLEETPEWDMVPDGEIVNAEVNGIEVRDSFYDDERNPGQKKKQVAFKFRITNGDFKNTTVSGYTPTTFTNHGDCKLRVWVMGILGADDLPIGFKLNTDDLVGLPVRLAMGVREQTARDGSNTQKNFVADVFPAKSAPAAEEVF